MALTQALVEEFLSASFMEHRVSVSKTRRKLEDGTVTAAALAGGFWYPGDADYYAGETFGLLNEHQHLGVFLEFLVRVDRVLARKVVDQSDLAASLSDKLIWYRDLSTAVAEETARQATAAGVPVPQWVGAATRVFRQLNVSHQGAISAGPLSLPGSAQTAQ
ncbi:hypothetical protein [Streptomyces sp. NPDC051572]|uniref:hypothetical protein n=1 Tax=unclassified Streptomyces TaxID=2593676 RepID=UPI00344B8B31